MSSTEFETGLKRNISDVYIQLSFSSQQKSLGTLPTGMKIDNKNFRSSLGETRIRLWRMMVRQRKLLKFQLPNAFVWDGEYFFWDAETMIVIKHLQKITKTKQLQASVFLSHKFGRNQSFQKLFVQSHTLLWINLRFISWEIDFHMLHKICFHCRFVSLSRSYPTVRYTTALSFIYKIHRDSSSCV